MRSIYLPFLTAKAATGTGQICLFAWLRSITFYYKLLKALKRERTQLFYHLYTSYHLDSWLQENLLLLSLQRMLSPSYTYQHSRFKEKLLHLTWKQTEQCHITFGYSEPLLNCSYPTLY